MLQRDPPAVSGPVIFLAGLAFLLLCPLAMDLLAAHAVAWFVVGFLGAAGIALLRAGFGRTRRLLRWRWGLRLPNRDVLPTAAECRFLDDVEHELRTPLAALMLVGENALAKLPPEDAGRDAIVSMMEEAGHMKALLEQLLMLSRCASIGAHDPQRTLEDAAELVHDCVQALAPVAEAKGQRVEVEADESVPVLVRRALVRQAVVNLVNNAIHHCPAGSVVSVGVRVDKLGRAAISVRDNGPGIAPEHQLRVFRRFDRGGAALRVSGRGLGLSNALAIARAHGGSIDLTSTPGQGARFTLRLPLAAVVEPRDTPLDSRLRLSA